VRPAEVSHHAVAEILRDTALEASYGCCCGTMIASDRLPPFFRIELRYDCGGTHEVAKQDGQMTALTGDLARGCRRSGGGGELGGDERSAAVAAKFRGMRMIGTALAAFPDQGSAAFGAKFLAGRIIGTALGAAYSRLCHDVPTSRDVSMQAIGCGNEEEKTGVLGQVEDFMKIVSNPLKKTSYMI
jgi:hypothetical protein